MIFVAASILSVDFFIETSLAPRSQWHGLRVGILIGGWNRGSNAAYLMVLIKDHKIQP